MLRERPTGGDEGAESGGQRGDEFQAKAETTAETHDSRQPRRSGSIKLNFEQIARVQQNAGIQKHAAFAHLRAPALDHGRGKAFRRHHADGQVDGKARPSAHLVGIRHHWQSSSLRQFSSNYEGEMILSSRVQGNGGAVASVPTRDVQP
jgi:hypothetical protein